MRISIEHVQEVSSGRRVVQFRSVSGSASACWANVSHVPSVGEEYDVEIDVDDCIRAGESSFPSVSKSFSIRQENDCVLLNGLVDSVDEDGLVYFRIAEDCLLMIESSGTSLEPGMWALLKFPIQLVEVHFQGE